MSSYESFKSTAGEIIAAMVADKLADCPDRLTDRLAKVAEVRAVVIAAVLDRLDALTVQVIDDCNLAAEVGAELPTRKR